MLRNPGRFADYRYEILFYNLFLNKNIQIINSKTVLPYNIKNLLKSGPVISQRLAEKSSHLGACLTHRNMSAHFVMRGDTHHGNVPIHMLDHLSQKYLRHFKLSDEGQYWETRDEKLLDDKFKQLNALMESFNTALDTQPMQEGETVEKYVERLLQQIHNRKSK